MLTKIPDILRTSWEQIHRATITRFPGLMSGAELARSSWAKHIQSYEGVPDIYKEFFEPIAKNGDAFPYTVLTPSHEKFIHRQTEKLICALDERLYVLENTGISFEGQCYPIDGISYVEFRSALLSSSLKICGKTSDGLHTSCTLKFNAVTDYLFSPILKTARRGNSDFRDMTQNSELERFNHLNQVNFKFMNYARHSLLEGEKVIHSILQPEIQEPTFAVLGRKNFRTISPTHMCILTDRELIWIREEVVRRKEDKYGGIWDYIPLNKIQSLSVNENVGGLIMLSLLIAGSECFDLIFQVSAKEEINQFHHRFSELTCR